MLNLNTPLGVATLGQGVGGSGLPSLPSGYAFVVDAAGNYYVDASGNYYIAKVS